MFQKRGKNETFVAPLGKYAPASKVCNDTGNQLMDISFLNTPVNAVTSGTIMVVLFYVGSKMTNITVGS